MSGREGVGIRTMASGIRGGIGKNEFKKQRS